jgi:hypothetical protein
MAGVAMSKSGLDISSVQIDSLVEQLLALAGTSSQFENLFNFWRANHNGQGSSRAFCRETSVALVARLYLAERLVETGHLSPPAGESAFAVINSIEPLVQLNDDVFDWVMPGSVSQLTNLSFTWSERTSDYSLDDLYTSISDPAVRKALGEFYTPPNIVAYILNAVGYTANNLVITDQRLLDPACGSGCFLIAAARRFIKAARESGLSARQIVRRLTHDGAIVGFDVKPLPVLLARIGLAIEIISLLPDYRGQIKDIPIFRIDALKGMQRKSLTEPTTQLTLFESRKSYNTTPETYWRDTIQYHYVVGNPPYVRVQGIAAETRDQYKRTFKSAQGRFDLSVLFLERGLNWLLPKGKLGFITSNKFFTSSYGKGIRELIAQQSSVIHILDLADTKRFGAAVLPCILVLSKTRSSNQEFPYVIARQANGQVETSVVPDLFKFVQSILKTRKLERTVSLDDGSHVHLRLFPAHLPQRPVRFWHFVTSEERQVLDKIQTAGHKKLDDLAQKIIVGLKTNADAVFADPMTETFIRRQGLERDLIYPLLRGVNVSRWHIIWSGLKPKKDTYVLYPHVEHVGRVFPVNLSDYPQTRKYLEAHRERLERRHYLMAGRRQWYEIWVHQRPSAFQRPYKIVTPDLAPGNTFALDTNGFFCQGSCFVIVLKDERVAHYRYVLGLLNSRLMEFVHKQQSTFIYAGRYRYWTSYMKDYPIVPLFSPNGAMNQEGQAIIEIVTMIEQAAQEERRSRVRSLETELDALVYKLYQLGTDEIKIVESFLQQ